MTSLHASSRSRGRRVSIAAVTALAMACTLSLGNVAASAQPIAPEEQSTAEAKTSKKRSSKLAITRIGAATRELPTEEWRTVQFRIKNTGKGTAKQVRVKLTAQSGVSVSPASRSYKTLKRGKSVTVSVKVRLSDSVTSARTVKATVSAKSAKSRSATVTVKPVALAPIRPAADTVFLNGKVVQYTDKTRDGVRFSPALAVRGGKIQAVGKNSEIRRRIGSTTRVIDLQGKTLMPGLGDGHFHGVGHVQCTLDYEGGTIDYVLSKIKKCLTTGEEAQWLEDENMLLNVQYFMGDALRPAGTVLTRQDLDRLSAAVGSDEFGTGTKRPIVVRNMDGHKFSTNTRAIEYAGVTASTDPGVGGFIGIGEDGTPNGTFADFRPASGFGTPIPPRPDAAYKDRVANIQFANSLGITQMMQASGTGAGVELAKRIVDDGKMTVHYSQAIGGRVIRGADAATVQNFVDSLETLRDTYGTRYANPASPGDMQLDTVKVFCDGVAEYPGQTAAMERPYRINIGTVENPRWIAGDNRGEEPSCDDARLGFQELDRNGWNIHVHGIGDRAVRVALDNFERILEKNPERDRRHAITHLQFMNTEDVERMGDLDVISSMSLQWAQRDGWTVEGAEGYHERSVLDGMYPARGLLDGGSVISAGSDWPVTDLVPWMWIENAVTRTGEVNEKKGVYGGALGPQHAITLNEALKASTLGVAHQMANDDRTGSIEVGKLADLIVLDRDIHRTPKNQISETKVKMTMLKGKVVYSAN